MPLVECLEREEQSVFFSNTFQLWLLRFLQALNFGWPNKKLVLYKTEGLPLQIGGGSWLLRCAGVVADRLIDSIPINTYPCKCAHTAGCLEYRHNCSSIWVDKWKIEYYMKIFFTCSQSCFTLALKQRVCKWGYKECRTRLVPVFL